MSGFFVCSDGLELASTMDVTGDLW